MSWVAAGVGVVSLGTGIYKSLRAGSQAKKARSALENQKTPQYAPNKAINDYYQNALARYQAGPYNSAEYGAAKKNAAGGLATGLNFLQGRKSALAGVGGLVQQYDNNLDRAGAQAEARRGQELSILGNATGMKAGDDRFGFNVNAMMPYQNKRNLYASQLSGANQLLNSGLQDIGSGINNAASIYSTEKMYGGGGNNLFSSRRRNNGGQSLGDSTGF